MFYSLKTYLNKFSLLLPTLKATLHPIEATITHRWSSESYHSCFWEEGENPCESPENNSRTATWEPGFTLQTPLYYLQGRLDDDGREPYWVLDLHIPQKAPLHARKGFRGPYQQTSVLDILEADLSLIPTLVATKLSSSIS